MECPVHIVGRVGTDGTVPELAVMAVVIGTVDGVHGGGQLAVRIGGIISVLIRIGGGLAVSFHHGDVIGNVNGVLCVNCTVPVFCQGGGHIEFRCVVDHFDLGRQGRGVIKIIPIGGDIPHIFADSEECQILHSCHLQPLPHGHKPLGVQRGIHGGVRFALKPVNTAGNDLVAVTAGKIIGPAVFQHGHRSIRAAGVGGTGSPFGDGLTILAGNTFLPDQNVLHRISGGYALSIELSQQRGVEALGGLRIGDRLSGGSTLSIAPPVGSAHGTGHIGGGIVKMIAGIALSHDHDQVQLCLAYGDRMKGAVNSHCGTAHPGGHQVISIQCDDGRTGINDLHLFAGDVHMVIITKEQGASGCQSHLRQQPQQQNRYQHQR